MESEFLVFSLGCNLISFVSVDDLPFLVLSAMSFPYNDFSSFFVFAAMNIKTFGILPIAEVFILVGENLPPSRVSAPDLHAAAFS